MRRRGSSGVAVSVCVCMHGAATPLAGVCTADAIPCLARCSIQPCPVLLNLLPPFWSGTYSHTARKTVTSCQVGADEFTCRCSHALTPQNMFSCHASGLAVHNQVEATLRAWPQVAHAYCCTCTALLQVPGVCRAGGDGCMGRPGQTHQPAGASHA